MSLHKETPPPAAAGVPEDSEDGKSREERRAIDAEITPETGTEVAAKKPRMRAKPKYDFPIPITAIAIDLDGTLVDSIGDLTEAVNRMRNILGFAPLDASLIKTFVGKGIAYLVDRALADAVGQLGPTAHKVALGLFEKYYAECCTDTPQVFPGVVDGLKAIQAAGFRLACVTNKAERFTLPILQKTALRDYFEAVICGDTLAEKKPHPMPILHIAEFFNTTPGRLLLIGDSVNDAQAARAAESPVFIVPYGYGSHDEIRGLDCDAYIDLLPAALKLIRMAT